MLFRALSRLGLFRLFVDHQRLVHTFETNLRGPAEPVTLAGSTVRAIVPAAVNAGNVAVSFDVLSYAGVLGVTIVTDPEVVDEPCPARRRTHRRVRWPPAVLSHTPPAASTG